VDHSQVILAIVLLAPAPLILLVALVRGYRVTLLFDRAGSRRRRSRDL